MIIYKKLAGMIQHATTKAEEFLNKQIITSQQIYNIYTTVLSYIGPIHRIYSNKI